MPLKTKSDEFFMKEAFKLALIAKEEGEVPVGAVITSNKKIIAKAYNQTEKLNDSTAHAEMIALTSAFNYLGAKYLKECTLYVTLEPCIMCAGAIFWSQLGRLVYGAKDPQRGFKVLDKNILHPKTKVRGGLLGKQCKSLLDDFFRDMRN